MDVRRRWAPVALAVCVGGLGTACTAEVVSDKAGAAEEKLTSTEEREVQQAFDDAACYCEAYLLHPPAPVVRGGSTFDYPNLKTHLVTTAGASCAGDDRLAAYAERFTADGWRTTCREMAASPHGDLPSRLDAIPPPDPADPWPAGTEPDDPTIFDEWIRNGCADAHSFPTMSGPSEDPAPGFCRAEINFCLAEQLRLKADSFARPPSGRGSKDAILQEARLRYERAASEISSGLNFLYGETESFPDGACRDPLIGDASYEVECTRLQRGYAEVLGNRLADAVSQVSDLLEQEVQSGMAASDALSPGLTAGTSFTTEMWGPDSRRLETAAGIAGQTRRTDSPVTFDELITGSENVSILDSVPADLTFHSFEEDGTVQLVPERAAYRLPTDLTVGGRTISAGTVVDVYLLHYDPADDSVLQTIDGHVGFAHPLVGVLSDDASLDATDSTLGAMGTTYPTGVAKRALEGGDTRTWFGFRVNFHFEVLGGIDQMRLVVLADPDDRERVVANSRAGDAPFAGRWRPDAQAQQALELMLAYRAPVAHESCRTADGLPTEERWLDDAEAAGQAERIYDFIDQAIMAERDPAWVVGTPIPVEDSPLHNEHGLRVEHFRAAHDLIRDLLTTMDVDWTFLPTDVPSGSCTLDAVRFNDNVLDQRNPRILAASMARAGRGEAYPLAKPTSEGHCASPTATLDNWYDFDAAQLERVGAAGAMHILRHQIHRLLRADGPWDPAILRDTTDLIDGYVGDGWTEYRYYDPPPISFPELPPLETSPVGGSVSTGGTLSTGTLSTATAERRTTAERTLATASLTTVRDTSALIAPVEVAPADSTADSRASLVLANPPPRGVWTLYGDTIPAGRPVLVRSEREAECLEDGHYPGWPVGSGCPGLDAQPLSFSGQSDPAYADGTPRGPLDGRLWKRWVVPGASGYGRADPAYILWQRCDGDCTSIDQGTFALADVIHPARAGEVHPFDGRFGELFANLMAKQGVNPAAPAETALGLAHDLVPPLEHELIDDGDRFEDSFQFYLDYALGAQARATRLLNAARSHEIEMLQYDAASEAQLEAAALAQLETVSAVCGADRAEADCEVETIDAITMEELGIVDAPASEPWVPPAYADCEAYLAAFPPSPHDIDDEQEMRRELRAAVGCGAYFALTGVANTTLHDVPVRVRDELAAGGDGDFSDLGGEVRQQHIALYGQLTRLRTEMGAMERAVEQALNRIDNAAHAAKDTPKDGWGCWLGGLFSGAAKFFGGAASLMGGNLGGLSTMFEGGEQLVDLQDHCGGDFRAQIRAAFNDVLNVFNELDAHTQSATDAALAAASIDGKLDSLAQQVDLARKRREIQERLATTGSPTGDPGWRALQGVEATRARDALLRAQRMAFVARRAIEFRLASDMPTMTASEAFVPAPSSWANDVFVLDTDTAVGEDGVAVLTAGEALEDYGLRLQDFVFGYSFPRRYAEGSDTQILNLSRVAPGRLPATVPEGDVITAGDIPFHKRLLYKCRYRDDLLVGGVETAPTTVAEALEPVEPCAGLGGVEYATLSVHIPSPLEGYLRDRLSEDNFNYRVNRIAVNMVGSALVDCTRAADPWECWGDGNLQYSMRQSGTVVVENYEREQSSFVMEPGVIQNARALAAERWLTNPLSSADRTLIGDFERAEWWGRPLSATYTLVIPGRDEIEWRNLEDIQLLLRYDYWTRQD